MGEEYRLTNVEASEEEEGSIANVGQHYRNKKSCEARSHRPEDSLSALFLSNNSRHRAIYHPKIAKA
jgi:hypothetical protein